MFMYIIYLHYSQASNYTTSVRWTVAWPIVHILTCHSRDLLPQKRMVGSFVSSRVISSTVILRFDREIPGYVAVIVENVSFHHDGGFSTSPPASSPDVTKMDTDFHSLDFNNFSLRTNSTAPKSSLRMLQHNVLDDVSVIVRNGASPVPPAMQTVDFVRTSSLKPPPTSTTSAVRVWYGRGRPSRPVMRPLRVRMDSLAFPSSPSPV